MEIGVWSTSTPDVWSVAERWTRWCRCHLKFAIRNGGLTCGGAQEFGTAGEMLDLAAGVLCTNEAAGEAADSHALALIVSIGVSAEDSERSLALMLGECDGQAATYLVRSSIVPEFGEILSTISTM